MRWTWRQWRGGQWHQSQPDYCMARDADAKLIWNVAFQQPRIHSLDHPTVVVLLLRGQHGQLRQYCQRRQMFPPATPPGGGAGQADAPFWEFAKNLQEECTGKAEKKRLDLGGELTVNCPSGNALLHWSPVPNRGALPTLPNWGNFLQG